MNDSMKFRASAATFERLLTTGPVIQAVNFHSTPRAREAGYQAQIERLSRSFSSVSEDELDNYLATGQWHKPKPGVIIAIYEGYRNGYDVLMPILERYGLVGWFFIITGFVKSPAAAQLAFAMEHDIGMATRDYVDGRYALNSEELRLIDRRHVIACHTRSHISLAPLSDADRESEVLGAQNDLTEVLGHSVRSFASYGGPPYGEHPPTDRLIDRAKFQFLFSNLKIQRLRSREV